jgi:hypothetical protein
MLIHHTFEFLGEAEMLSSPQLESVNSIWIYDTSKGSKKILKFDSRKQAQVSDDDNN